MHSSPPSSPSSYHSKMSEYPSYESSMADLKLKRFVSHCQTTHGQANDDHEHCSTDYDSASPDPTESTQRSNMNALKGLKVDQPGMIWRPNGTLRGRVVDDSPAHPEVEGYPLDEKVEVLDEDGQKTGHALAHEISAATRFMSTREHPFYKLRPDGNGQYHCPYTSLEDCWHRPEKLKYKFQ